MGVQEEKCRSAGKNCLLLVLKLNQPTYVHFKAFAFCTPDFLTYTLVIG